MLKSNEMVGQFALLPFLLLFFRKSIIIK